MGIGYVPQGHHIFSQMSVEDNLLIALMAGSGQSDKSYLIPEIPEIVFDLFPALYSLRQQRSGELQVNQQQQLALRPKLLILDEPTDGMSP